MRSFLGALIGLTVVAALAPVLSEYGPAQARVALAALVVAAVYVAAKVGAPRAPVLRHVIGLAFAGLAIWVGWVAHEAVVGTPTDVVSVAARGPEAWHGALAAAAEERRFPVGGRDVGGGMLLWLWSVLAVLTAAAGLLGAHHAAARLRR